MKQVKGKFRSFMVSRNHQNPRAAISQFYNGLNEEIKGLSRDIVIIEQIPAVNKQIGLNIPGVVDHGLEIPENGVGPPQPSLRVRLGNLGHFKTQMGVSRMYEFQEYLSIVINHSVYGKKNDNMRGLQAK